MNAHIPTLAVALILWAGSPPALAHSGHATAPGSESAPVGSQGVVEVSRVAQLNLGLTVEEANLRPLETTLRVIGEIQADPRRSGAVSSRISGRVSAVLVQEGERVAAGQPLVEVESLQLGDPPSRVRYVSPVSGVVTDRHLVVGDEVEPQRHLFEVSDLSSLLAVGRVFEREIGQVAVGQKVRVRVPSYPGETFEGSVERLAGKLEEESRSLAIYARLENPDGRLRPHMRASLTLVTGGSELALVIPKAAVLGEGGARYAFVQSEDHPERFARRPLVLGNSNDRFVEVIDGLFPGEGVVVEGSYSLQYLAPVATAQEGEPAATASGPRAPAATRSPGAAWSEAPRVLGVAGGLGAALLGVWWLRGRSRRASEAR